MPTFTYRARDKEGQLITGEIESVSADELKDALFHEGMVPLEVRELRAGSLSASSINSFLNRVKPEELMIFTRQFYTLFKAGVSMDTILSTMVKQVKSRSLQNALIRIKADLSSGASLSQAFGRHPKIFNTLYTSMLMAGEEAGILDEVLAQLSDLLEKDTAIQKNIKGATLYPKIVVFVLVSAIVMLMVVVVPKFKDLYSRFGAELPLPTQILIGTSNFFTNYWYIAIILVGTLFFFWHRFSNTKTGRLKIDRIRFNLPIFGDLNIKVANARFGHILAALYRSGMAMPRSLEVVANVIGNAYFALEVQRVRDDIQRGSSLSEALSRQEHFPPVVVETTAVGEQTGSLGEMLSTVAQHYDMEVTHTIKNLTTLLEPIMMIGIFAVVLLLALAIFLPIWGMSTLMSGRKKK